MKIRRIIAITLWVLTACGLVAALSGQIKMSSTLPQLCIYAAFGLLLFFVKGKPKEENAIINSQLSTITVKHFAGLPLAQGVKCVIQRNLNGFVFVSGSNSFNLSNDKITDMCIKTDTEIQKQYVSSVGRAVGGAILFGPIGAMIGGRAKQKQTSTQTRYLIFTYLNDGQVSYAGFEIHNPLKVQKWIKEFRNVPHARGASITL